MSARRAGSLARPSPRWGAPGDDLVGSERFGQAGGRTEAPVDPPPATTWSFRGHIDLLRTASAVCPPASEHPPSRIRPARVPGPSAGRSSRHHHPHRGDTHACIPFVSPFRTRLSPSRTSRRVLLAGGAAGAALALLAACSTADAAAGGSDRLALVAYSTPQKAYDELIPAFTATAAGKGVTFTAVLRRLRRPEPRGRRRPARRRRRASPWSPTSPGWSTPASSPRTGTPTQYKGIVTESVVVLVVRKGNPKGIQGWDDLRQAGHRGRHARTRSAPAAPGGTSWPPTARRSRTGKTPTQALAYLEGALQATWSVQDDSGREGAADLHRRRRRRADQLRERGDRRPAEAARTSTTSCPTRPS